MLLWLKKTFIDWNFWKINKLFTNEHKMYTNAFTTIQLNHIQNNKEKFDYQKLGTVTAVISWWHHTNGPWKKEKGKITKLGKNYIILQWNKWHAKLSWYIYMFYCTSNLGYLCLITHREKLWFDLFTQ